MDAPSETCDPMRFWGEPRTTDMRRFQLIASSFKRCNAVQRTVAVDPFVVVVGDLENRRQESSIELKRLDCR